MARTAMIRARVEPGLKESVDGLFHRLGLNAPQAIELFDRQVQLQQGLPFEVKIPNAATRRVFEATDRGVGIRSFRSKKAFFKDLGLR